MGAPEWHLGSSALTAADATRQRSAAIIWQSICVIDRLVSMMLNLPLGTDAYGFPYMRTVMSGDNVIAQAYCCRLADIAAMVQEIDESYLLRRPETQVFEKVFKVDQELRSLSNMTPQSWWSLGPDSPPSDHILQYWHYYLTARTHLQFAQKDSADSQYAYSYMTCTQACRNMAARYVKLRGVLPPGFFAGRILDVQAMTSAVFLLYTSYGSTTKQTLSYQDDNDQSSTALVYEMLQMMQSVSGQAGGDFARQAATAIRGLDELLNRQSALDSQTLSLRIPMLGRVTVKRHSKQNANPDQSSSQTAHIQPSNSQAYQSTTQSAPMDQDPVFPVTDADLKDILSWSMDFMDDMPTLADDTFEAGQWLSYNDITASGQS